MALDRTWYNTLVDDSGSGTDGTIWDKAAVDALMDAVDAMLLFPENTDVTLPSGTTNDYALPAGTKRLSVDTNAAGSTLAGMSGGVDGRVVAIMNIGGGGGTLTMSLEAGTSAAANRFVPAITLASGQCGIFLYTNRWRCIGTGK